MPTLKETKKETKKSKKKQIPEALIYEKVKGKPIYYRNYEKVLKGELPLEAVMGSSDIQAYLVALIVALLYSKLNPKEYLVLTNEVGFFTSKNSYRLLDIAVFERKNFKFKGGYTKIPPKVVVEIDTKADLSNYNSVEDYIFEKTQELLDAGVEKVVWILTKPKKVMIAERNQKWIVQNWNEPFEVFQGIEVNLSELVKTN